MSAPFPTSTYFEQRSRAFPPPLAPENASGVFGHGGTPISLAIGALLHGALLAGLGQVIAPRIGWSAAILPATAGGAMALGALNAVTHAVFFALFPSAFQDAKMQLIPFVLTGIGAVYLLQWSLPALFITVATGALLIACIGLISILVGMVCRWRWMQESRIPLTSDALEQEAHAG